MTWFVNEIVRSGNSTARVKSFNTATSFIVLFDIQGSFPDGCTIVGDDSGTSGILNGFTVSDAYDGEEYATDAWDELDYFVGDENGLLAIDEHFNGTVSQDYQTTYLVKIDGP